MKEGISRLKNQWEISQRFYFFSSGDNITIEEAYRFLNNKWMEKRINALKRTNVNRDEGKNSTANRKNGEANQFGKKGSRKENWVKK